MKQIRLVDGAFFPRAKSATLAGDNLGLGPKHFEWVYNDDQSGVTFFTDICLEQALDDKSPKKVAWLIEPAEVSRVHYDFVADNISLFDYILTWGLDPKYVLSAENDKWLFYPFGGSWIRDWQLYPKSKLCSIITSEKDLTEGHQLRHEIVKRFGDKVDIYGHDGDPMDSKLDALRDYQYSIVVENAKVDYWFTEKLIDCFATGTIPIYWGCPSVSKFFPFYPQYWLPQFDDLDDLENILHNRDLINVLWDRTNLVEAQKYRCTEDWIYEHYPFLFEV